LFDEYNDTGSAWEGDSDFIDEESLLSREEPENQMGLGIGPQIFSIMCLIMNPFSSL
jgi:hypothetical protein